MIYLYVYSSGTYKVFGIVLLIMILCDLPVHSPSSIPPVSPPLPPLPLPWQHPRGFSLGCLYIMKPPSLATSELCQGVPGSWRYAGLCSHCGPGYQRPLLSEAKAHTPIISRLQRSMIICHLIMSLYTCLMECCISPTGAVLHPCPPVQQLPHQLCPSVPGRPDKRSVVVTPPIRFIRVNTRP